MTDYTFCYNQILDGQKISTNGDHETCSLEWNERINNGICGRCGKEESPTGTYCNKCKTNPPNYQGYGR